MPWCPICKNEYKEGYTVCADCKAELVDSLEEIPVAIYFGSEKELASMAEFLEANGIEGAYAAYDEQEEQHELYVKQEDEKAAKRMLKVFLRELETKRLDFADLGLAEDGSVLEQERDEDEDIEPDEDSELSFEGVSLDDLMEDETNEIERMESAAEDYLADLSEGEAVVTTEYRNKRERSEEYKSSGWALAVVSVLGLAFIALNEFGILPVHLSFHKPMVYGVMGTLFVLFLGIAIYSFAQAKKILVQAEEEDALKKQLQDFLSEHFPKEKLLELGEERTIEAEDAQTPEDDGQLYFACTERMKEVLAEAFADADGALIEHLVDEYYEDLFA